jgi:hypothetical protein
MKEGRAVEEGVVVADIGASLTTESENFLDQIISKIPGFVSKGELQLLYQLAAHSTAQVVELGAFAGLSTSVLCWGAKAAGVDVVTVDSFIAWSEQSDTSEEALREILTIMGMTPENVDAMCSVSETGLRENLAAFGFSPRIINGLTWEVANQVDGPIGLFFHDADHVGESVEKDLAAWTPKMAEDGVVAIHDYANERWPEVTPAVDKWAAREGWEKGEHEFRLQVFRRKGISTSGKGL